YRRRSALWFRRGLIIKVTNAHESSSRRYSGNSDDATEITDIVDGVSKTGAYRQTQAEAGRDPPELLPGEEPRAGEDPMQEPIAVESARYTRSAMASRQRSSAKFGEGWQLKVEVLFETLNPNSTLKHTARPKYRRGDWVQFASKGAGQTVTRWQVSEAHLSLGQWKYSLVDPDTGKHAQAETIGQSGSSLMILEDV
ncbi:hypothetical protein KC334_g14646, partial [Hortaea werneckii]